MTDDLVVPELLAHQVEAAVRPEPFQCLRWGRRAGKSVYAFHTAMMGRGPATRYKGLAQGYDIIWVGRSLEQARIIWSKEIKPRFDAAGGYTNDTHLTATVPGSGLGTIKICSQDRESINNARGDGKNIGGIVGDEVAHWDDAETVWLEILLPMLTDNEGWATFISTTRAGSWFNGQCEAIQNGTASPSWFHSYKTALDNPRITRGAFDRMLAEYRSGDVRLDQEVWAKLVMGGTGAAFPEWRDDLHLKRLEPLPRWPAVAGLDWGYSEPGALELALCGPGGRVHLALEVTFQGQTTEEVGWAIGRALLESGVYPDWIAYDSAMDHDGPTIVTELRNALHKAFPAFAIPLLPVTKGPGSRASSKVFLHDALRYTTDDAGDVHAWGAPRLTIDPVRCPKLAQTLPRLQRAGAEERNQGDISQKPKQADHWYDALRYLFMMNQPHAEEPVAVIPDGIHPGFIPGTWQQRGRRRDPETEQRELLISLEARGIQVGGRYQRPRND